MELILYIKQLLKIFVSNSLSLIEDFTYTFVRNVLQEKVNIPTRALL